MFATLWNISRTAFFATALVAAACSGEGRSTPPILPTETRSVPPGATIPAPEGLAAALLTLEDMSPDWELEALSDNWAIANNDSVCPAVAFRDYSGPRAEPALAYFLASEGRPFFLEAVGTYAPDVAGRILDDFRKTLSACGEWTDADEDTTHPWSVFELQFPSLGADSVAFRLSTPGAPITKFVREDWVVIQRNSADGTSSVVEVFVMRSLGVDRSGIVQFGMLVLLGDDKVRKELSLQ